MTDQHVLSGAVLGWWLTFVVHSVALLLVATVVQWAARRLRPLWRDAIWKLALVIPLLSATLLTAGGVHPGWLWRPSLVLPVRAVGADTLRSPDESGSPIPSLQASRDDSTGRVGSPGTAQSSAGTDADSLAVPHETGRVVTRVLFPFEAPDLEPPLHTRQQPAESVVVDPPRPDVSELDRTGSTTRRVEAAEGSADLRSQRAVSSTSAPPLRSSPWGQFAICFLLVCWTWSLTRCGVARMKLRRLIQQGVPNPELDLVLTEVRLKLGYRGRVRLRVSERICEPMACGVLRPTVLLPTALLRQLDRGQLQEILAHELSHLARRDLLWLGLFRLVGQLVPGHCLAGWAARRWRENAELLCDDWMLHHGFSRTVLAAALVMVSEWKLNRGARTPVGCVTFASRSSAVSRRVMRLLDGAQPGPAKWTGCQQICWLAIVAAGPLVACRCLPAASLHQPSLAHAERTDQPGTVGHSAESRVTGEDRRSVRNVGRDTKLDSLADVDQELLGLQSELQIVESLLRQLDDPGVRRLAGSLRDRAGAIRERLEQLKTSSPAGPGDGRELAHVHESSHDDESATSQGGTNATQPE